MKRVFQIVVVVCGFLTSLPSWAQFEVWDGGGFAENFQTKIDCTHVNKFQSIFINPLTGKRSSQAERQLMIWQKNFVCTPTAIFQIRNVIQKHKDSMSPETFQRAMYYRLLHPVKARGAQGSAFFGVRKHIGALNDIFVVKSSDKSLNPKARPPRTTTRKKVRLKGDFNYDPGDSNYAWIWPRGSARRALLALDVAFNEGKAGGVFDPRVLPVEMGGEGGLSLEIFTYLVGTDITFEDKEEARRIKMEAKKALQEKQREQTEAIRVLRQELMDDLNRQLAVIPDKKTRKKLKKPLLREVKDNIAEQKSKFGKKGKKFNNPELKQLFVPNIVFLEETGPTEKQQFIIDMMRSLDRERNEIALCFFLSGQNISYDTRCGGHRTLREVIIQEDHCFNVQVAHDLPMNSPSVDYPNLNYNRTPDEFCRMIQRADQAHKVWADGLTQGQTPTGLLHTFVGMYARSIIFTDIGVQPPQVWYDHLSRPMVVGGRFDLNRTEAGHGGLFRKKIVALRDAPNVPGLVNGTCPLDFPTLDVTNLGLIDAIDADQRAVQDNLVNVVPAVNTPSK